MINSPQLIIDLNKIKENAKTLLTLCLSKGISLMGVTKSYSADINVSRAFKEGGISKFADSRIENIIAARREGFNDPYMLLRIPMKSQAAEIVKYAQMSVNSELSTIEILNEEALKQDCIHDVMLMLDVGDLREGVWPDGITDIVAKILKLEAINLFGLGTNLGCYGGVLPSKKNLLTLVDAANKIQTLFKHSISVLSAGGTSVLNLLEENEVPLGINEFRIGEAIMTGKDSVNLGRFIPYLHHDAFILEAEIIELKNKPSVPIGNRGPNAFNELLEFEDKGIRKRAILAIGKQDMFLDRLKALDSGIEILGGSSDHFILDVTECERKLEVGDHISFIPEWDNVLRLTSSSYVSREYIR